MTTLTKIKLKNHCKKDQKTRQAARKRCQETDKKGRENRGLHKVKMLRKMLVELPTLSSSIFNKSSQSTEK